MEYFLLGFFSHFSSFFTKADNHLCMQEKLVGNLPSSHRTPSTDHTWDCLVFITPTMWFMIHLWQQGSNGSWDLALGQRAGEENKKVGLRIQDDTRVLRNKQNTIINQQRVHRIHRGKKECKWLTRLVCSDSDVLWTFVAAKWKCLVLSLPIPPQCTTLMHNEIWATSQKKSLQLTTAVRQMHQAWKWQHKSELFPQEIC